MHDGPAILTAVAGLGICGALLVYGVVTWVVRKVRRW